MAYSEAMGKGFLVAALILLLGQQVAFGVPRRARHRASGPDLHAALTSKVARAAVTESEWSAARADLVSADPKRIAHLISKRGVLENAIYQDGSVGSEFRIGRTKFLKGIGGYSYDHVHGTFGALEEYPPPDANPVFTWLWVRLVDRSSSTTWSRFGPNQWNVYENSPGAGKSLIGYVSFFRERGRLRIRKLVVLVPPDP